MRSVISPMLFLLILVSILPDTLFAQVIISGKVQDGGGVPLSQCYFILKNNNGIANLCLTDSVGYFNDRAIPGVYITEVTYLGEVLYSDSVKITADKDFGLITVDPSRAIESITITSSQPRVSYVEDKIIFDVAGSTLDKPFYDVLDILKRSPLLYVSSGGSISIGNEPVTIKLEGQEINLSGELLVNFLRSLNARSIRSIEIKPTTDASQDASRLGGNVNIILKEQKLGLNTVLRTGFTDHFSRSFSTRDGINFIGGGDKILAYGNYTYNFNRTEPLSSITLRDDHYNDIRYREKTSIIKRVNFTQNHTINTGLIFKIRPEHTMNLNMFGTYTIPATMRFTSGLAIKDGQGTDSYAIVDRMYRTIVSHTLRITGAYTYGFHDNQGSVNITGGYLQSINKNEVLAKTLYHYNGTDNSDLRKNEIKSTLGTISIDVNKKFSNYITLTAGIKFNSSSRNRWYMATVSYDPQPLFETFVPSEFTEHITGSYFSIQKYITKELMLRLGLRYEYYRLNGSYSKDLHLSGSSHDWFPNAYLSYRLDKDNNISFSYSRNIFRIPFSEMTNFIEKWSENFYNVGNPHLRPQYINNFNIAYRFRVHNFRLTVTHHKDVAAQDYYMSGDTLFLATRNKGDLWYMGAGYTVKKEATSFWSVNGSAYGYWYDVPKKNYDRSRFNYTIRLFNQFTINDKTSVEFSLSYRSNWLDLSGVTGNTFIADISINRSLARDKFNLRMDLTDLLDMGSRNYLVKNRYFKVHNKYHDLTRSITLTLIYSFETKKKPGKGQPPRVDLQEGRL